MFGNDSPFTDDFVRNEIKFMELNNQESHDYKGIKIKHKVMRLQVNDYLNKRFHIGNLTIPCFTVDNHFWMSLTPMEIQSNFLAWATASGEVGMGGLGIGYTALRTADQEDVDQVTVFEKDKRVIEFFTKQYQHRPEFKKIIIIEGDARKTFKNYSFDFVYMDIYDSLLTDSMLSDLKLFTTNNEIGEYHFWTEEKIILAGIMDQLIPAGDISYQQKLYFQEWQKTEESEMYDTVYDVPYIKKALTVLGLRE